MEIKRSFVGEKLSGIGPMEDMTGVNGPDRTLVSGEKLDIQKLDIC